MNRGALILAEKLREQGLNQAAGAREVNLSESFFGRLLVGKRKPGIEGAIAIRNRFSVPLEAWMEEVADDEPTREAS